MPNLRELRVVFRIATVAVAVLCVVMAGLLIFMHASARGQEETFHSLHSQVQNKRAAMVPPQVVDDRVKEAREQIANFYEDRFPPAESSIFQELGKLATANQVHLAGASYKTLDADITGIEQVRIGASLYGNYAQAMKFINSVERDKMFFIVDGVSLGGEENAGNVRLNILLETYMRNGAE